MVRSIDIDTWQELRAPTRRSARCRTRGDVAPGAYRRPGCELGPPSPPTRGSQSGQTARSNSAAEKHGLARSFIMALQNDYSHEGMWVTLVNRDGDGLITALTGRVRTILKFQHGHDRAAWSRRKAWRSTWPAAKSNKLQVLSRTGLPFFCYIARAIDFSPRPPDGLFKCKLCKNTTQLGRC